MQGLYLGGGFPEVFAAELANNQAAQQSVRQAIQAGMPTYAECGGLMYLCEQIVDFAGQSWKMVGILPTTATMTGRLSLGYRRAIALQDSPLLPAGSETWGHEFHRSSLSAKSALPLYQTGGYDADSLTHLEGCDRTSFMRLTFTCIGDRIQKSRLGFCNAVLSSAIFLANSYSFQTHISYSNPHLICEKDDL